MRNVLRFERAHPFASSVASQLIQLSPEGVKFDKYVRNLPKIQRLWDGVRKWIVIGHLNEMFFLEKSKPPVDACDDDWAK